MECPLSVSQAEYDAMSQCEAVIVREYERDDGGRFAQAVAWGDYDEMVDQAETPGLYVVPVGVTIICQRAIRTEDLLQGKS